MTAFEERGHFWWEDGPLPENALAPNNAVSGRLLIEDGGSIRLELDSMLTVAGPLSGFHAGRVPDGKCIRGILKDTSTYALLGGLNRVGTNIHSNAVSREDFSPRFCLVGDRDATNVAQLSEFDGVEIDLKGLEQWLWVHSISFTRDEADFTATYHKPTDLVFPIEGGRISIDYKLSSPWGNSKTDHLSLKEIVSLRLQSNAKFTVDEVMRTHMLISDLLILLTGRHIDLDWPTLSIATSHGTAKLYFAKSKGDAKPPTVHDWWVPFGMIRDSFGQLFETWRAKREEYGPGLYSYLGTRRSMQLYIEHRFLSLVLGIESFHRQKYPASTAFPAQLARVDRITEQAAAMIQDDKDRRFLERLLEHAREPTLAVRIAETFSALPLDLDQDALGKFATRCGQLRNDLSHYGGQRERTGASYEAFIRELDDKSDALSTLSHLLVLSEIGISTDNLREIVTTRPSAFRIQRSLERAGLIKPPTKAVGSAEA